MKLNYNFKSLLPIMFHNISITVLVKEKDEQINLTEKNKELKKKIEDLEIEQDRQEQYSRRNCLLLQGI